ncbi:toll/interleukin-1 receptor domain-containing protein, partial [Bacillus velezensis]
MDTLRRLKFEANGIIGVLRDYSNEPMLTNLTDQFKISLEKNDIDSLLYSLEQLRIWYTQNLDSILRNEFVHNKS